MSRWDGPCARCGKTPTRRFMNSRLCQTCAPPQPKPDPARTAAGLRRAAAVPPSNPRPEGQPR